MAVTDCSCNNEILQCKKAKRHDGSIYRRVKKYDPEKVILFGSQARGASDPYSDIDLVIVKKTHKPFLDRLKDVITLIKPNFAIDILVYTPEELQQMVSMGNPFVERVLREGIVIYEKT